MLNQTNYPQNVWRCFGVSDYYTTSGGTKELWHQDIDFSVSYLNVQLLPQYNFERSDFLWVILFIEH